MKPTMTAKRKISAAVIAVLLSALLAVSGVMIYRELHTQQKEKEDFRELAEMVAPESDAETEPETQGESETSETAKPEEALRDLSGLFAENSECIQNRLEDERRGKDGAHIDRKLRRRIRDKNEALGIKQG